MVNLMLLLFFSLPSIGHLRLNIWVVTTRFRSARACSLRASRAGRIDWNRVFLSCVFDQSHVFLLWEISWVHQILFQHLLWAKALQGWSVSLNSSLFIKYLSCSTAFISSGLNILLDDRFPFRFLVLHRLIERVTV